MKTPLLTGLIRSLTRTLKEWAEQNPALYERLKAWSAFLLARITLGALCSALAMYLFAKIAHEVMEDETRAFDFAALLFLKEHRSPLLYPLMKDVSWLAGGRVQPFVVALAALGFWRAKRFMPDGLTLLLATAGGMGLIVGLKHLFHRPRPDVIFTSLGYSFPSGHSFFALVVYGLLAVLLTKSSPLRTRIAAMSLAAAAILLVGFSRMYVGEHFPSDVAAGYAVGFPWLWVCSTFVPRWRSRRSVSNPTQSDVPEIPKKPSGHEPL